MEKKSRELERGGLIVFVLFTIANGMNYLFQIVMGRLLSVEDFGTLNSLLSLFMMTTIPSGAVTALVAKYLVEYSAVGNTNLLRGFLNRALKAACVGFFIISLVGMALSPFIARYLKIDSVGLVVILVVLIALNLLMTVATGTVQGLKQFPALGLLGALSPALKLVMSALFVWLGYKIFGALTAIGIAILITLMVSFLYIRRQVNFRDPGRVELEKTAYLKFFVSAFSLTAFMAALMNMDMLLIKHYLPQSDAGFYSPAMILAHIILYAPLAFVQVLYPLVVEANVKAPRDTYKLLGKVFLINTVIIAFCTIAIWTGSTFVLQILFGEKYLASALYILPASLFIVPISYLMLLMNYSMAIGNTKFLTVTLGVGCLLCLFLISFNHNNIFQILSVMTGVSFTVVLANLVSIGLEYWGVSLRKGQQI